MTDGGAVVQGFTDTMHHEPSRLLSDTQGASHFAGGDTVCAVAKNPEGTHPFIQPKGGVFEDGSNLGGELLLASSAKPDLAGRDERVLFRSTPGPRNDTVREAQIERVLKCAVGVREVNDGLLQCVRGFHDLKIGFS
jgi:hypothetical protein